jgi:hypothetical protein
MRGGATQAMSIVEERQRCRCPRGAGTRRAHGDCATIAAWLVVNDVHRHRLLLAPCARRASHMRATLPNSRGSQPGYLFLDKQTSNLFNHVISTRRSGSAPMTREGSGTKPQRQRFQLVRRFQQGQGWYGQPMYPTLTNYWSYGWSTVYASGYTWKDRVVTLETLIYSIENDELIWAGRSETENPKDIRKFVNELIDATAKEMRKSGLLPKVRIQHLTYLNREMVQRERLLYEMNTFLKHAVMGNYIGGISRSEQTPDVRVEG